jgi:hypothetical protein
MCPSTLITETTMGPPEHENSVSMFHALDALECAS